MDWIKYPHLERLDSEEVEGILEFPNLSIEPKIDGANASVFLSDGEVKTAKRTAILSNEDSFNGFQAHVKEQEGKFRALLTELPNHIVYGEWLVKHTVSWYRPEAYGKFYAYDLYDAQTRNFLPPETRISLLQKHDILQVQPLAFLKGPVTEESLDKFLDSNRFLIDEPGKLGEGFVIKAFKDGKQYTNKFGRSCWAKKVRQAFKDIHGLAMGGLDKELPLAPEKLFADAYVTEGRIEKLKQKILETKGTGWRAAYTGEILGRVYHEVFNEELWSFVSKNKIKNISFKDLNYFVIAKAKELLGL